jgi:hypothetical protein
MAESLIPNEVTPSPTRRRVRRPLHGSRPSSHDEMIVDILKHLTTLNSGLLAILSIFGDTIDSLVKSNLEYGSYFFYSFYLSLVLCMIGFMLTIISLQNINRNYRKASRVVRDACLVISALMYMLALMFLMTLYITNYQQP